MRKYDIKNKRNIGIIIGISVIIIIMFSLIIKFFLGRDKTEYVVSSGALVFDKDKSIVKVEGEGIIKKKWNKEYYLTSNDKSIELGNTAISYNDSTGEIILYGKYYEIGAGDIINITDGETVIKSSALTKFYKLADRKYLVIDKDIKTADGLLSTSDFLMVDLDKVGNATLVNHKVNLKAFAETTIVTSNYTFDIANEILTYGSNKIDLKKIIGSSNTYTKEDLIPEEDDNGISSGNGVSGVTDSSGNDVSGDNDTTETGTGTGTGGGNGIGDASGEGTAGGGSGSNTIIEEIKKASKRTSVVSVTTTTSKITVDYVIYDPYKEYTSVYMEVENTDNNKIDTIYLNKNDTRYEFSNVFPNSTYKLVFKYSYIDEEGNSHTDIFDSISVTTKKPSINLKVTKVGLNNNINYLITTDNSYNLDSGILKVFINDEEVSNNEIELNGNTTGSIYINAKTGDKIELFLTDVKAGGKIIKDVKSSDKFIY